MTIPEILKAYKTIAVVGQSDKPDRPSYSVSRYMLAHGYRIVPINPNLTQVFNQPCYPSLLDLPSEIQRTIEIVNIFRKPANVLPIVDEAIAIGAKVIWMQLGITNEAARKKAESAGLIVVQNHCIAVDHRLYLA
ncbi:MAG: CoA-binding protein [Candidatus Thermochlorobacter sp.]